MATRKSTRLATKKHQSTGVDLEQDVGDDRGIGRRASVGDALSSTPQAPKGRNLVIAKAAGAAEAAAARLDELNAGEKREASERKRRKSSKARKAQRKKQVTADRELGDARAYQPKSRPSCNKPDNILRTVSQRRRTTVGRDHRSWRQIQDPAKRMEWAKQK